MFCACNQELMKMFNDSNSFYYCEAADLTTTIQSRHRQVDSSDRRSAIQADDRFFWNKHMLPELVDSDVCKVQLTQFDDRHQSITNLLFILFFCFTIIITVSPTLN